MQEKLAVGTVGQGQSLYQRPQRLFLIRSGKLINDAALGKGVCESWNRLIFYLDIIEEIQRNLDLVGHCPLQHLISVEAVLACNLPGGKTALSDPLSHR